MDADGTVTVTDTGEFQIKAVKAETVEYDQAEAVITLTAVKKPSSSGSSGGDHTVSVDADKHGTVTVSPKRADKGDTVTITVKPDKGYELDELTVTDKSGDTIKIKDKGNGKFTFTMPGSKVTVEAGFKQIVAESEVPAFADVPADAYYADAVAWAVKEGITTGTGTNTFSPDLSCTRAQMVTFLWLFFVSGVWCVVDKEVEHHARNTGRTVLWEHHAMRPPDPFWYFPDESDGAAAGM